MGRQLSLTGRVVSGSRKASFFTQLDWVQEQCATKLGFSPYPGTLNVELAAESLAKLLELEREAKTEFVPPDPKYCVAKLLSVSLGSIKAAMIFPAEEVRIHGKGIVEIIAPVGLKDVLNIKDGDRVSLTVAMEKEF